MKFTDNDLKVININVRGIATNFDNLITWLASIIMKFYMLIIVECHIQNTMIGTKVTFENMYPITGYKKFYKIWWRCDLC